MRAWIANLSTRAMLWISGIIGFLFTANQGVSVSGWLLELDIGLWAVLINLIRNTILASVVVFLVLYAVKRGISRPEIPGNDETIDSA
ncbi:MAG: hypothetical protein ABFR53_10065 [Actinomycetota bacterium]